MPGELTALMKQCGEFGDGVGGRERATTPQSKLTCAEAKRQADRADSGLRS